MDGSANYTYSVSGQGTGKVMDGAMDNYGSDYHHGDNYSGKGWWIIIVIIIIIIIICCIWWFWNNSKNNKGDSCDHLHGTHWKGDGHYAGTKLNPNLQEDCHLEWMELKVVKAYDKCLRVEGNFKLGAYKGYKLETRATGSFEAVGVLKDGVAHLTVVNGPGELLLKFEDDHNLSYVLTGFNNIRGTGEKGVSSGCLEKVVKHDY